MLMVIIIDISVLAATGDTGDIRQRDPVLRREQEGGKHECHTDIKLFIFGTNIKYCTSFYDVSTSTIQVSQLLKV